MALEEVAMATGTVLFPWNDSYSVNIGTIDVQHKNLVNIVNELHQAMKGGVGRDKLGQILSDLIKYTQEHFATEERLMYGHAYPEFPAHKSEHERLTSTVLGFQRRFLSNEVGLSVDVMEFLENWLIKHILGSDKKYSPFLIAKGVR
jgi:hemerythrin